MTEHPVRLVLSDELDRNRLTVFFRLLLAIPHYIWLALWGIAALLAAIANWVATLIAGRSPDGLHRFLAAYVKYATHVYAYLGLAANPYPAFDGSAGYPVDVEIAPPGPQSRLGVAVRIVLAIPAALLAAALVGAPSWYAYKSGASGGSSVNGVLRTVAFFGWFAILARGRMPRGLRDAAAYALAYGAQFWSYLLLLTDRYPNSDPAALLPEVPARADPIRFELDDDLRRSRLTVFFRLLLAIPHIIWLALWGVLALLGAVVNWVVLLFTGRTPSGLRRFLCAYLRYLMHVYAFLHLLANPFPGFTGRAGSYPLETVIEESPRQNRWTVFFRLILALPAFVIAGAYGGVAYVAAVLGWFASLFTGRMPRGLREAIALALRYNAQTIGYVLMLTGSYPYSGPSTNRSSDVVATFESPLPAAA